MKLRAFPVSAAGVLALSLSTFGQTPARPTDFAGVKFGASVEEARAVAKSIGAVVSFMAPSTDTHLTFMSGRVEGWQAYRINLEFSPDGKFVGGSASLNQPSGEGIDAQYRALVQTLTLRFGRPLTVRSGQNPRTEWLFAKTLRDADALRVTCEIIGPPAGSNRRVRLCYTTETPGGGAKGATTARAN